MKNRFVSLFLMFVMVFSAVAVFSLGSFSENDPAGVTVSVGSTYAVRGGTAILDIYVSAEQLPATYDHLNDWTISFSGAQLKAVGSEFYVSGGNAFSSVYDNTAACVAGENFNIGTSDQILSMGGMKIASLAFEVPEDAPSRISVSVDEVLALRFAKKDWKRNLDDPDDTTGLYSVAETVQTVSGTIYVESSVTGSPDPHVGTGEDYEIPMYNSKGERINNLGENLITGTYRTLLIPAEVVEISENALSSATVAGLILKNSQYTELPAGIQEVIRRGNLTVYYQRNANGTDTTKDVLEKFISEENLQNVELKNNLMVHDECKVDGNRVSFIGGVTSEDSFFSKFIMEVYFPEHDRMFTAEYEIFYRTLKDVASVIPEIAEESNLLLVDMSHIVGLTVTGMPDGQYTAVVTIYGISLDAGGNRVAVCSDSVTIPDIVVSTSE